MGCGNGNGSVVLLSLWRLPRQLSETVIKQCLHCDTCTPYATQCNSVCSVVTLLLLIAS